jgi:hypothetical protein
VLSEEVGNGARVPSRQSKVTVEAEVVEAGVVMGIDGVGGGCCLGAVEERDDIALRRAASLP